MHRYLVVIEETSTGYSAYLPDVPGCVATGHSQDEVEQSMREAVAFHFDGLRTAGLPIPEPVSSSAYVDIAT